MNSDTSQQILDVAQELLQSKGFHAFSYADIAEKVGIRKASIHYHFASKNDLAEALVKQYRARFSEARAAISKDQLEPIDQLKAYADLYRQSLGQNRLCLCGMLAADFMTLTEPIQAEVRAFMSENAAWLATIFAEAKASKTLSFSGSAQQEAEFFLSSLEGGMLVARAMNGLEQFDFTLKQLFAKYR